MSSLKAIKPPLLIFLTGILTTASCRILPMEMMVKTGVSDQVTSSTAVLSGSVIDHGDAASGCGHFYSESANVSSSDNKAVSSLPAGNSVFSTELTNLESDRKYYYRAYITDGKTYILGDISDFTTLKNLAPVANTLGAQKITNTSARFSGEVNANGQSTSVIFDYGLTESYGSTIAPAQGTVTGTSLTPTSADVSGLISGMTYHYRVRATSNGGTSKGSDQVFSTTISDPDGNTYDTITIGHQMWMKTNLLTTKYSDSTEIPHQTSTSTWISLSSGAYCDYQNNSTLSVTYGRLYNWYAVNTGKLCPDGWGVPTNEDWDILQTYLVSNGFNYDGSLSGNKIAKSMADRTLWDTSVTTGAIGNNDYRTHQNRSGFTAVPSGSLDFDGVFRSLGTYTTWWSATEKDSEDGWTRYLNYNSVSLTTNGAMKIYGVSVRCLRK